MERPEKKEIISLTMPSHFVYDANEIDTYLSSIADVESIKRAIRPLDIMHETKRNWCFENDLYQIATAISSYIKGNK